ncbi:MAG: HWE histidine kinase domain-containing protein [Caulobacter sp.]|nr:HWE histidine kinase domain-containing protein [Caulobacter sp.]
MTRTALEASSPLATLVEAIEQLSTARTVQDIATVVRSRARAISGADGITVVLRDGDHCHYLDEEAIGPLWKGKRFPLGQCISGWTMLTGETAVIPDIYRDDRIPFTVYRPTFVNSLVMTPVRREDPMAAIGAYWKEVHTPSADAVAGLEAVARAAATAFENVRLLASLEEALRRREQMIRELDHRVKNTLAATLSVAKRTLRSSPTPAAFAEAFEGRLMALSRAHELLAREDWSGGDLAEALGVGCDDDDRVQLRGAPVRLASETAMSFVLVFHELADNARRHGALSVPGGRVTIDWVVDDGRFELTWLEWGGPPVRAPVTRGFGSQMIERGLPRDVGGAGRLSFEPDGLRYGLTAPLGERIAAR